MVGRLIQHCAAEIDDIDSRRAKPGLLHRTASSLGVGGVEVRRHVDKCHDAELGQRRKLGGDARPQLFIQRRCKRHQHAHPGDAHEVGDLLRLEHWVDRQHDASGFAAPNGEVGLGQVRKGKGDRMFRRHPKGMEGIRRPGHIGQEFGVCPDVRPIEAVGGQEKGQSLRVGGSLCARQKCCIRVLGQHALHERPSFDGFDIRLATNGH